MNRQLNFTVDHEHDRLDRFLAVRCADLSRSRLQRLIADGCVTVDKMVARSASRLRSGQVVTILLPDVVEAYPMPQNIPVEIKYRDDDFMVVNKPAGMTVHPAPGHPDGTLVNAVLAMIPRLADVGPASRPGIVHRLDKDTSGLLVIAINEDALECLSMQLRKRAFTKGYLALVQGCPSTTEAIIEAPIGRDPNNRKRMAIVASGREASTYYRVLTRYERCSLVEIKSSTGRTHQIRVHFASLGHPLVGDTSYGIPHPSLNRQFLHANVLGFNHPSTGERLEFTSELPGELAKFMESLTRKAI